MPHLKHPLQLGGRWLRQATVLGVGAGLAATTGLIVTASAASAHPHAASVSSSRGPARACMVIVGRRDQVRVRPQRCRPPMAIAAAGPCRIRLAPAPRGTVSLRPAHPPRLRRALGLAVRARGQVPVAVRVRGCKAPPAVSISRAQVRLCGPARLGRGKPPVAVRLGRVRVMAPIRAGRGKPPVAVRLGRVRLMAPVRACAVAVPPRAKH
jgi:hypothetical protein